MLRFEWELGDKFFLAAEFWFVWIFTDSYVETLIDRKSAFLDLHDVFDRFSTWRYYTNFLFFLRQFAIILSVCLNGLRFSTDLLEFYDWYFENSFFELKSLTMPKSIFEICFRLVNFSMDSADCLCLSKLITYFIWLLSVICI